MVGTLLGIAGSAAISGINNALSSQMSSEAAYRNYYLNEQAAIAANARQRKNYKDFYSPEALLRQYREAGLSPSMMFGGTPGQGGMSAPAGAGAAGPQPVYQPMSLLEAMQVQNIKAQNEQIKAETEKTKEETHNIKQDTAIKELETSLKEMTNSQYRTEFELLNSTWEDKETSRATSLFEIADNHYSYESYLEAVRNGLKDQPEAEQLTRTEQGQRVLREIYTAASKLNRDISILSEEQVSANFQIAVLNKLNEKGFAEQNATTALQQLKALSATSELTETQKNAWNSLIDKLGKKGSTMRDIVVVLGMILSNFASHTGIKVNVGK